MHSFHPKLPRFTPFHVSFHENRKVVRSRLRIVRERIADVCCPSVHFSKHVDERTNRADLNGPFHLNILALGSFLKCNNS